MADIQTETVKFPAVGESADGFLARPQGNGPFPGVIVIQEWWGLNDNIKDIAQRFAREGFAALAPDLYHGPLTKEPDEAQKLMIQLDTNHAGRELTKAADWLDGQPHPAAAASAPRASAWVGGLALTLACDSPRIKAVAPFYGANPSPIDKVQSIAGPVLAI